MKKKPNEFHIGKKEGEKIRKSLKLDALLLIGSRSGKGVALDIAGTITHFGDIATMIEALNAAKTHLIQQALKMSVDITPSPRKKSKK